MMLQLGSSIYMILCTDRLVNDNRIWREEFIIPGTFDISAGTNAAGTLTRWYRDHIFGDLVAAEAEGGPVAYAAMTDGLADIPPGSDGLVTLPYFAGERTPINDPKAKGILCGLTLAHTRKHMYRSALEAVGFSVNQHFEIFAEHNVPITKIMATGGGTKNPLWMQMMADITGKTIHTAGVTIGASYGDALMAAMGIKYFPSYAALAEIIKSGDTFTPNAERHEEYKKYQAIFDELYLATKDIVHRL